MSRVHCLAPAVFPIPRLIHFVVVLPVLLGLIQVGPARCDTWMPLETVALAGNDRFSTANLSIRPDGIPDIIWEGTRGSWHGVLHSERTAEGWSVPERVLESEYVFRLVSTVAPDGTLWLAFHRFASGGREILVAHGNTSAWSGLERVSPVTGKDNYAPKIAAGPSSIWLTWYADNGAGGYDVYVVRRAGGVWGEAVNLTKDSPGNHWFCDIAVDGEDRAHVVWGDGNTRQYYYASSPDNASWSDPFAFNPPLLGVFSADWPACSIVCDAEHRIHVAWCGQKLLDPHHLADWDIYYSMFDGSHWSSPRRVNVDNTTVDAYPVIQVSGPGDIWIGWMDGNPAGLGEYRVRTARSTDGSSWSEWRIDDDTYFYDHPPVLAIDPDGRPWAAWSAAREDFQNGGGAVVVTHFEPTVPIVQASVTGTGFPDAAEIRWSAEENRFVAFEITRGRDNHLEFLTRVPASGSGPFMWRDTSVSPGRWDYDVAGVRRDGQLAVLGRATVTVGAAPDHLTLLYQGRAADGTFQFRLGLPSPSGLVLQLFDVQGRLTASDEIGVQGAGWTEFKWSPATGAGSRMSSGLYWLTAHTDDGGVAVVRLMGR